MVGGRKGGREGEVGVVPRVRGCVGGQLGWCLGPRSAPLNICTSALRLCTFAPFHLCSSPPHLCTFALHLTSAPLLSTSPLHPLPPGHVACAAPPWPRRPSPPPPGAQGYRTRSPSYIYYFDQQYLLLIQKYLLLIPTIFIFSSRNQILVCRL